MLSLQKSDAMTIKETIKSLIAIKQQEIPVPYNPREVELPLNAKKIITVVGVRRCGKSTLMELCIERILKDGVSPRQIAWIGFDDERFDQMQTSDFNSILEAYMEMYPDIPIKDVYFFFDEIQRIEGWELFVMRLFKLYSKHIFISGSNADMLSEELNTALRGWPLEYKEYPLSFGEYCQFKGLSTDSYLEQDLAKLRMAFDAFVHEGGYPEVVLEPSRAMKDKLLQGYFNTMIFRDLIERYNLSNPERVKYVIKRLMAGMTKPASINAIYNDMRSQGRKVSKDDLYDLAEKTCNIFLLYKVTKFDQSFKKETSALPKYYCVDNGLRQSVLIPGRDDDGILFENAVYLQLLRNLPDGEKICYYLGDKECDFVIQTETAVKQLIQVCWDMKDKETRGREVEGIREAAALTHCADMTIVTRDQEEEIDDSCGIIHIVPAWKWFLGR